MKPQVRATPFHSRAASANRGNAWEARNRFTLACCYLDVEDEALAARLRVAIADISWRWRVMFEGEKAAATLGRLFTRDVAKLTPGEAVKALWLTEAGGVRGAGVIARYGKESFLLASAAMDEDRLGIAAAQAGVMFRDLSEEEGGLAIVGPHAAAAIASAGLDSSLEPLQFRKVFWRGLDVTVSRWGEHNGYEIWCRADDGPIVWDRLMRAGEAFGIVPAGVEAMDILDLEAGIVRPVRDYDPAREPTDAQPTPRALGLESLIDADHAGFIGREAWLAARDSEQRRLAGLELDGNEAAINCPVQFAGRPAGHTIASCYSFALRRPIAIAQVDEAASKTGTVLSVTLAPTRKHPTIRTTPARVCDLPFLPVPTGDAP